MNLKRLWLQSILLCLCFWGIFVCTGCEHRPLEMRQYEENIFVRVYYDENIRNVSYGFYDESKKKPTYSSPQVMRVVFCDETTDNIVAERYLYDNGRDERGYYIQGLMNVPDGRYNIMAYNFDTRETQIKNRNNYSAMVAYTAPLSESEANRIFSSRGDVTGEEEPICRQPEHLFVTKVEGFEVATQKYREYPDTVKTEKGIYPTAESIVKTYYLQFNVKGVEHVRSAVALITGMAGSKNMHTGEMVMEDAASIFFGLNNGKDKARTSDDIAVAYASFNTFGKLPHTEGYIEITFEFNTVYNTVQTETFRITDLFETEEVKENQWIIIDKTIEIVPPEGSEPSGGGLTPGVNDWIQVEGSITI